MKISATADRAALRARLLPIADGVAVLLAISLPWSTSATGILAAIYLIVSAPLINADSLRGARAIAAAWLPVALVVLAVVGMLWADATMAERLESLSRFVKLLFIPVLFNHCRRSEHVRWIVYGYLASCTVLLAASMIPAAVPALRWMWPKYRIWSGYFGVPVKDYIIQGSEFLVCIFILLYLSIDLARAGRRSLAVAAFLLSLLFAGDILLVQAGRTVLVTLPVLLALFGARLFGWKGLAAAMLGGLVLGGLALAASPGLRQRVLSIDTEIQSYERDDVATSAGKRLEYWKKSLQFIAAAPLFGHGTGSITEQFRGAVIGSTGPAAEVSTNPHNQTLAVGIQLGLAGMLLLLAMWSAHLVLFGDDGFLAFVGLMVVANNVVESLFNSHLFDFAPGWLYVILAGACGGAVLRKRREIPYLSPLAGGRPDRAHRDQAG